MTGEPRPEDAPSSSSSSSSSSWSDDPKEVDAGAVDEALRRFREGDPAGLGQILGEDTAGPVGPQWLFDLSAAPTEVSTRRVGERFGSYVLGAVLGRGGAGVVHEAFAEHLQRKVAVKILRAGVDADPVERARFAREARTLARLRHAHIATLYDAGVVDGVPYLALEFVDGAPLDAYARDREISLDARLTLFEGVLDAVEYAHRRGVLHRDLKPTNILVDDQGVPRILDFGLARLLDSGETEPDLTAPSTWVGTLPYMSPEQAQGAADEVDTRADVYSLGVVLYELLAGKRPLDPRRDQPLAAIRMISETAPPPPSTHSPDVDADLDTIVLKALAKSPAERYPDVRELREDLRRFRHGFPIEARPASWWYRTSKLVRRRKRLSAFVAVAALSVLGLLVGLEISRKRARAAEREAGLSAARAQNALEYLERFIADADPNHASGPDQRVRQLLDRRTPAWVDTEVLDPVVRAALHGVLGRVHTSFGQHERASEHLERARNLAIEHLLPLLDRARADRDLAFLRHAQRRFDEAEVLHRAALRAREDVLPPAHEDLLQSREELAELRHAQGDTEEAIALRRQNYDEARRAGNDRWLEAGVALARVYVDAYRLDEAAKVTNELTSDSRIDVTRRVGVYRELARVKLERGDAPAACALLDRALEVIRSDGRGDTLDEAALLLERSMARARAEDMKGSVLDVEGAIAIRTARLGTDHAQTVYARWFYAQLRQHAGQLDAALSARLTIMPDLLRIYGSEHRNVLDNQVHIASLLYRLGDLQESRDAAIRAIAAAKNASDAQMIAMSSLALGEVENALGDYCAAEQTLRGGLECDCHYLDKASLRLTLAAALHGQERYDAARQVLQALRHDYPDLERPPEGDPTDLQAELALGLARSADVSGSLEDRERQLERATAALPMISTAWTRQDVERRINELRGR